MNIEEYEKYYQNLEHGKARKQGIQQALNSALEKHDTENVSELYYKFIEEDFFYDDAYQAVIIFPEYLAFFEQHIELHETYKINLMWAFKLFLCCCGGFYQIPLQQILNIFKSFENMCEKFGYSKRVYYRCLWYFLNTNGLSVSEFPSAKECYLKMIQCPQDELCDGEAGDISDDINYFIEVENNLDKAFKRAEPLLSGKLKFSEIPDGEYIVFAKFYFQSGDLKNATRYAEIGFRLMEKDSRDGYCLYERLWCATIFSYSDATKGLKILKKCILSLMENKNGADSFHFYRSAYHIMLQIENKGQKTVNMKFPWHDEEIYNPKGVYSVSKLKNWFYAKAKFFADKFDERNGNNYYNSRLNEQYHFDTTKPPQNPIS